MQVEGAKKELYPKKPNVWGHMGARRKIQAGPEAERGALRVLEPLELLSWSSSNVPFIRWEDRGPESQSERHAQGHVDY